MSTALPFHVPSEPDKKLSFVRKLSLMADDWYKEHIQPGMDETEARNLIYEYSRQKLDCSHPNKHIVYRLDSLNRKMFRWQCPDCLEVLSQSIKVTSAGNIPPEVSTDYTAENRVRTEISQRLLDRFHSAKNSSWWDWYNEYLQTPQWKTKRDLVMKRAGGICEGCGKNRATQVHHLTYSHVGNEFLFELVAICDECHTILTEEPKHG